VAGSVVAVITLTRRGTEKAGSLASTIDGFNNNLPSFVIADTIYDASVSFLGNRSSPGSFLPTEAPQAQKKGATSSDSTTLIVIVVVLLILLLLLILVGLYVRHRYQEQLKSNMTQAIVTKRKGDDDDDEGSLSHVGQDIAGPSQISLHTTARRNQVTPSDAEDKPAWEDEKKIETLV